jgi:hypothetical protein
MLWTGAQTVETDSLAARYQASEKLKTLAQALEHEDEPKVDQRRTPSTS